VSAVLVRLHLTAYRSLPVCPPASKKPFQPGAASAW
jgi:hypothetical protein